MIIGEEEISEKQKLENEAWEIINQLLSHGIINLLNSKQGANRKEGFRRFKRELKESKSLLKTILETMVNARKCPLTRFPKLWRNRVQKISSDIKRGRPRKISGVIGEGVNIDQDIKGKFQLGIAKFYLRQNNVSSVYAFEQTIKEYFRDVLKDTPDKLPTYNQFLYWLRKNENLI